MNIFSVVIVLFILAVGVAGMKRGILKELVVVLGTILVFVLAFFLKDPLAAFLCSHLPEISLPSILGPLSSLSIFFYQIVAFLILFALFQFVLKILIHISGILGKIINATIILALPNKLLGLLVGLLEGYFLAFIFLTVLMIPLSGNKLFMDSGVRDFILNKTPVLKSSFGGITHALNDIVTMDQKKSENESNLKVVDTMLKHKVISPEFVEEMVKKDKLKDVVGLDQVLEKYKEEEK